MTSNILKEELTDQFFKFGSDSLHCPIQSYICLYKVHRNPFDTTITLDTYRNVHFDEKRKK